MIKFDHLHKELASLQFALEGNDVHKLMGY